MLDPGGASSVVATSAFKLRFDRLLLPGTATRQAVCLQPKLGNVVGPKDCSAGVFLELSYDPVRREVTARQAPEAAPLAQGTRYELTAYAAVADTDTGFRTFDGIGLEARVQYEFAIAPKPGGICGGKVCKPDGAVCGAASECCSSACTGGSCGGACVQIGASCTDPKQCCSLVCTAGTCAASTCKLDGVPCATSADCCGNDCAPPRDVVPTGDHFCTQPDPNCTGSTCARSVSVVLGGCALTSCHLNVPGDAGAAEGMELGSAALLLRTAIDHPAHETQTGEHARDTDQSPLRFGRAMPILDPKVPGNSYLLYKLLANRSTPLTVPFDPGADPTADPPEVARLRRTLVVGMPMPPTTAPGAALLPGEAEWLSEWLLQGAPLPQSGLCQ